MAHAEGERRSRGQEESEVHRESKCIVCSLVAIDESCRSLSRGPSGGQLDQGRATLETSNTTSWSRCHTLLAFNRLRTLLNPAIALVCPLV